MSFEDQFERHQEMHGRNPDGTVKDLDLAALELQQ